jgi:hypothetical protein
MESLVGIRNFSVDNVPRVALWMAVWSQRTWHQAHSFKVLTSCCASSTGCDALLAVRLPECCSQNINLAIFNYHYQNHLRLTNGQAEKQASDQTDETKEKHMHKNRPLPLSSTQSPLVLPLSLRFPTRSPSLLHSPSYRTLETWAAAARRKVAPAVGGRDAGGLGVVKFFGFTYHFDIELKWNLSGRLPRWKTNLGSFVFQQRQPGSEFQTNLKPSLDHS